MTTAFVLSGGGSLGAVQVGMLLALEEGGIKPDLVVGTSVGALNGAWVAGAKPITDLGQVWRSLRRQDVFPARLLGGFLGFVGQSDHLVSAAGLRRTVAEHLSFERMEDATIPFHVVATDVLSGEDVRLSSGSAVDAVLASAAIPGVFPPVEIDGRSLMDGGAVNNTPISHAAALGADQVWVLTTGYACALQEPPRSALGMGLHALSLAIEQRLALDALAYAQDVALWVVPPLCPISVAPTDFTQANDLIQRAYKQTETWLKARSEERTRLGLHVGDR